MGDGSGSGSSRGGSSPKLGPEVKTNYCEQHLSSSLVAVYVSHLLSLRQWGKLSVVCQCWTQCVKLSVLGLLVQHCWAECFEPSVSGPRNMLPSVPPDLEADACVSVSASGCAVMVSVASGRSGGVEHTHRPTPSLPPLSPPFEADQLADWPVAAWRRRYALQFGWWGTAAALCRCLRASAVVVAADQLAGRLASGSDIAAACTAVWGNGGWR